MTTRQLSVKWIESKSEEHWSCLIKTLIVVITKLFTYTEIQTKLVWFFQPWRHLNLVWFSLYILIENSDDILDKVSKNKCFFVRLGKRIKTVWPAPEKPSHPARRSSSLATRSSGTWGGSPSRGVQMSRSVEPREPLSAPSSPTERWWPSRTHEARGQPAAAAGVATLGGSGGWCASKSDGK